MIFDAIVDRDEYLQMSGEEVQGELSSMFPNRKLYSHSLDWRNSDRYILKARGEHGDVIVGWRNKDEQTRKDSHKSDSRNRRNSLDSPIRSNEKGTKGRG